MKNKNKILFLILSSVITIFLINCLLAEQTTLGTFKQNNCIELVQICSNCSFINITTIKYPNSSLALDTMIKMTKTGTDYNYTFCNTSALGKYIVNGFGDLDGSNKVFNYDFEITPSGLTLTTSQTGISIGILLSIIFITFFFGMLSLKFISDDKTFVFGLFFLLIAILISIYGFYLGVTFSTDYLYTNTSAVQEKMFIGLLWGLLGMTFLGLLFLILSAVSEFKERKSMQKYGEGYNTKTQTYNY